MERGKQGEEEAAPEQRLGPTENRSSTSFGVRKVVRFYSPDSQAQQPWGGARTRPLRALRCEVRPRGPPSRARLENNAMSPGVTLPVSDGGARSKRYGEGDWKAKAPHGELWDSIHKAPLQRGRTQVPKGSPMALGKETLVCTSAHCFCPVIIIIKG